MAFGADDGEDSINFPSLLGNEKSIYLYFNASESSLNGSFESNGTIEHVFADERQDHWINIDHGSFYVEVEGGSTRVKSGEGTHITDWTGRSGGLPPEYGINLHVYSLEESYTPFDLATALWG